MIEKNKFREKMLSAHQCNGEAKLAVNGVDFEKRLVKAPVELDRLFTTHEEAKEFFTSLSFTNQKEYVNWIEGAKKEETRKRRLETALEKLLAGKRNPTEK